MFLSLRNFEAELVIINQDEIAWRGAGTVPEPYFALSKRFYEIFCLQILVVSSTRERGETGGNRFSFSAVTLVSAMSFKPRY
jgi:hypothetical protein